MPEPTKEEAQLLELSNRYLSAMHAMQSGVAFMMSRGSDETEPKHLRVGVNAAMSDQSALAQLLIDRGIITKAEYMAALAAGMEAEKERYVKRIQEATGKTHVVLA